MILVPLTTGAYDDCEIYGTCAPVGVINQYINSTGVGTETDPFWSANFTAYNDSWSAGGSGDPNPEYPLPFDQSLNTTDSVIFNTLNITTVANISDFVTHEGQHTFHFHSLNDDLILDVEDVEGANYFEIATAGAFLELWANPNPSNGYKLFTITETQGSDTEVNFYEGGTGHNRFWDSGSARFGGDEGYLCSNLTTDVDCDTPSTGADIVVEDDGWFGGKLFSSDWSNVSGLQIVNGLNWVNLSTILANANVWTNINNFTLTTIFAGEINGSVVVFNGWGSRALTASSYGALSGRAGSADDGDVMANSGSLKSVICDFDITSYVSSGSLGFRMIKNGGIIHTETATVTGDTQSFQVSMEQPRDTDTFVAGDVMAVYLLKAGGSFTFAANQCNYEVYYDD